MVSIEMVSTQVAHAFSLMDALWILCVLCAVYLIGRAVCRAWDKTNEFLKEKKEVAAQGEEDIFFEPRVGNNNIATLLRPDEYLSSDFEDGSGSDCEL